MTKRSDRDLPYKKPEIYKRTSALVELRQRTDYAAGVLLNEAMDAALALDSLAFSGRRPVSRHALAWMHEEARRRIDAERSEQTLAEAELLIESPVPGASEVAV